MKLLNLLQAKSLTVVIMSLIVGASCSKNSTQESLTTSGSANTVQEVVSSPTSGVDPALKIYANSVSDETGLLNLGGVLNGVNIDVLTKSLGISLRLQTTVLFLAQSYLLKYPQIQTSITNDVDGSALLNLKINFTDAVAFYKKWQKKHPDQAQTPPSVDELPPIVVNNPEMAFKISGVVNPPSHEERIAMRDRNRANGDGDGGGLDGGIYMQGAFELITDANGTVTSSNIIIHGTPGFTAVGRIVRNGSAFTLNLKESGIHDVGTLVLTINGNTVSGKMHHGGGKEWIYGDAVGNVQ